jgi:hypothetical protein
MKATHAHNVKAKREKSKRKARKHSGKKNKAHIKRALRQGQNVSGLPAQIQRGHLKK